MNFSLEFLLSFAAVFSAALLFAGVLHDAQIKLETKQVQSFEFGDVCNILYISNFGIKEKEIHAKESWCLSPRIEQGDKIYISKWYELLS